MASVLVQETINRVLVDGDEVSIVAVGMQGPEGSAGADGPVGPAGPAGEGAGGAFKFSTSTVMADPGSGRLSFNNATIVSSTSIALSKLTNLGTDIAPLLRTLVAGD